MIWVVRNPLLIKGGYPELLKYWLMKQLSTINTEKQTVTKKYKLILEVCNISY